MHWEGYITSLVFVPEICKFNLTTRKIRENQMNDNLQNTWPVAFPSAKAMKGKTEEMSETGGDKGNMMNKYNVGSGKKDISGKIGEILFKSVA